MDKAGIRAEQLAQVKRGVGLRHAADLDARS
jgi:hypothetical protein